MRYLPFISQAATVGWLACTLCAGATGVAADGVAGRPAAAPADASSHVPAAPVVPHDATPHDSPPAVAPTSTAAPVPAPAPLRSVLDSEPIRRRGGDGGSGTAGSPSSQGSELSRVGFALALVIALIFFLRWLGRKIFHQPGTGTSTRGIQVLARAPMAPRQHIVLVRVGRRVIVVGECGSSMNPLCEISDGDEVAALLGQLQDEKSKLPTRAFGALFNRAKRDISGDGERDEDDSADVDPEIVRRAELAEQDHGTPHEHTDEPAISDTRSEITGLMAKIRVLSSHFRNGQA